MTVVYPRGFQANGISCGIKKSGELDLSLVVTSDLSAVPAAAVFTQNLAAAAPVQLSRTHLQINGGMAVGVVASSGNANAATGARGLEAAKRITTALSSYLGCAPSDLLVCATGLIGIPLPVERVEEHVPQVSSGLSEHEEAGQLAARALMTTDTFVKVEALQLNGFRIGAMAKGAAMISPNMATMLAVITTDAVVESSRLHSALAAAVELSFNRLTIDGCTSTNDTVIALASGASGVSPSGEFEEAMYQVCQSLADKIAMDAEGASKLVRVTVSGARNDSQALAGARKIAESQLVKCSFLGEDPYWGRLASELGSASINFEIDRLSVSYQGVPVAKDGVSLVEVEDSLTALMAGREIEVVCDLGLGVGSATITTTDLGYGYIDENKGTS